MLAMVTIHIIVTILILRNIGSKPTIHILNTIYFFSPKQSIFYQLLGGQFNMTTTNDGNSILMELNLKKKNNNNIFFIPEVLRECKILAYWP